MSGTHPVVNPPPSSRPRAPFIGGAHSASPLSSTPTNAMFHSFSSSNGDGSLHHPVSTSSVPHGLLPLPSSSLPDSSSFPTGCYLHRSSSTHSLAFHHHLLKSIDAPQPAYSSSPSFSSCPVRRVVSTGDLQVAKASIFLRLHPSSSHFGWFLTPKIESLITADAWRARDSQGPAIQRGGEEGKDREIPEQA